VEAQHRLSTRRLVDSEREHEVLEELLEARKPRKPPDCRGLHYLLATPFRYAPLRRGSRFAARHERAVWYGSETLEGCFAEVAYYRLVFLEGSAGALEPLAVELSAFRASAASERAVDLCAAPFERYAAQIASPTSYGSSQRLGADMRADGVELFRYPSARLAGAVHVGLFTPSAFARRTPTPPQTWHCVATKAAVELSRKSYFTRATQRFERGGFLVAGRLPVPAV